MRNQKIRNLLSSPDNTKTIDVRSCWISQTDRNNEKCQHTLILMSANEQSPTQKGYVISLQMESKRIEFRVTMLIKRQNSCSILAYYDTDLDDWISCQFDFTGFHRKFGFCNRRMVDGTHCLISHFQGFFFTFSWKKHGFQPLKSFF